MSVLGDVIAEATLLVGSATAVEPQAVSAAVVNDDDGLNQSFHKLLSLLSEGSAVVLMLVSAVLTVVDTDGDALNQLHDPSSSLSTDGVEALLVMLVMGELAVVVL